MRGFRNQLAGSQIEQGLQLEKSTQPA